MDRRLDQSTGDFPDDNYGGLSMGLPIPLTAAWMETSTRHGDVLLSSSRTATSRRGSIEDAHLNDVEEAHNRATNEVSRGGI